jgi:gliding motility-associated-like protein
MMMCVAFATISFSSSAQNLVSNGDFEVPDTCPDDMNQLHRCHDWFVANLSPDYYNCGFEGNLVCTFPAKGTGYVHMISGLMGMTGFPMHNEMIKSKLLQPLVSGKKYKVEFSLGFDAFSQPTDRMNFGIYFFSNGNPVPTTYSYNCAGVTPQIFVHGLDVANYQYNRYSFCYSPDETMDSLLIGPFCNANTGVGPVLMWQFMFDDLSVTEIPATDLASDEDEICQSETITFSSDSGNNVSWIFEGGQPGTFTGDQPVDVLYTSAGVFDVTLIDSTECGVDTMIYTDYITVHSMNEQDILPDSVFKCIDINIDLTAQTNLPVLWSTGNAGAVLNVTRAGTYYCTAYGLCDTITDSTEVIETFCECDIFIPTAFTPNNDGLNESFRIYGTTSELQLYIFNRWGEMLFRTANTTDEWNGRFNDQPAPSGIYLYKAIYRDCFNKKVQKAGSIMLLR